MQWERVKTGEKNSDNRRYQYDWDCADNGGIIRSGHKKDLCGGPAGDREKMQDSTGFPCHCGAVRYGALQPACIHDF